MAIQETIDLYMRRWKRFDNYASYVMMLTQWQSRRKLLFIILFIGILLLYILPSIFRYLWSSPVLFDNNAQCVEQYVRPFASEEANLETNIFKSYEDLTNPHGHYLPYVGNGKFAISLHDDDSFRIMGVRSMDVELPFHPMVHVDLFGAKKESATVMRFKEGIVNQIVCFDYVKTAASIKHTFYAHRDITSLFVQEIKITNPSDVPLFIKLKRTGWTGNADFKTQQMMLQSDKMDYSMLVGSIKTSHLIFGVQTIGVAIASPQIPESFEVNAHSQRTLVFKTFLNYTSPVKGNQVANKAPQLQLTLRDAVKRVIELSPVGLERHHTERWRNLWSSGFGISYSKAPAVLNGNVINATIYYVLSQRIAFPLDHDFLNLSDFKQSKSDSLLLVPDRCYTGHSTLQASTLWSNLDSLSDVNRITALWLLTLEKQGCHHLIESGADGVMQAMMLSLASLQFTNHHLEFNADPSELHRNYFIRRVLYDNSTAINISVTLTDDNKAQIFVILDKNSANKDYYACDGGCLDPPVKLSSDISLFPVKLTEPMTAILYITSDKQHIEELKHTIHVKEVNEAPAHEHETIVLHRYGHSLAGLPALFWISIVFLIVIFHLFLGKLIYNEYCGGSSNVQYERHRQGRYAM